MNADARLKKFVDLCFRVTKIIGLKILNPVLKIDSFFNLTLLGKQFKMLIQEGNKFAEQVSTLYV